MIVKLVILMKILRDELRVYLTTIFGVNHWVLEDPSLMDNGEMSINAIETPVEMVYVTDFQVECAFSYIIKFRYSKAIAYHDLPLHAIEEIALIAIGKLKGFIGRTAVVEASFSPSSKDWILSITISLKTLVEIQADDVTTERMAHAVRVIMHSNVDEPGVPFYDRTFDASDLPPDHPNYDPAGFIP